MQISCPLGLFHTEILYDLFFLSVLYTYMGICSATFSYFSPLTEPLVLPWRSQRFFVVLGSWRYISPAVPYRRLSYEMKIQTIFSVHVFMYMWSAPFYLISCFLFVACYFQHSTTHVIMLLIVLVSIESNFINISFPLKNNVISPYEKRYIPVL